MSAGVVILIIIVVILILGGIGVGLYFLLRKKPTPPGGDNNGGPSGLSGTNPPTPPSNGLTGPLVNIPLNPPPSSITFETYQGGLDGNDYSSSNTITTLADCQTLCRNDTRCQTVRFDAVSVGAQGNPTTCYLQAFDDTTNSNVSVLSRDRTKWYHYVNKSWGLNNVADLSNRNLSEDECRTLCGNFILSNSSYNGQVMAEYGTDTKACLCKSSTKNGTSQSYKIY